MSNLDDTPQQTTIDFSPWQPILLAGAIVVLLALAVINWLAYWLEDATGIVYLLPLWLGGAGWLTYLLHTFPRQLWVDEETLTLRWWGRITTIATADVTGVRHGRNHVVVETAENRARFSFIDPNGAALLLTWLEEHVPAATAARLARANRSLPITLTPRLTTPIITVTMALGFSALGGLLVWSSWRGNIDGMNSPLASVAIGLVLVALAALLFYMVIDSYIWRITFDAETITLRHTLRTEHYATQLVTKMALVTEERTVKGFVHLIYQLRLSLMDGTELTIAPNLPSFPMDYAGAEEARLLAETQAVLEAHYVPVIATDVDPATLADARWGVPQATYQWQIRPYDLTVTRLDYGEHHAAASTVHILVGHAEAGAMRFRTTNGEIRISPDGRYIVIFDTTLLIVFNLESGRTYHRPSRQGWLYYQVQIVAGQLVIEEMKRTNVQQRELRNPIALEAPTSALRQGFGSAEAGDFPSAYG